MHNNKIEIVEAAKAIVENRVNLIEGARYLTSLLWDVEERNTDEDFRGIRGFTSETDDYPLGAVRDTWATAALAKADAEMEDYLQRVREPVLKSCRAIIQKYS